MKLTDEMILQRMDLVRQLHALGVHLRRERLRRQHPQATSSELGHLLKAELLDGNGPPDPAVFRESHRFHHRHAWPVSLVANRRGVVAGSASAAWDTPRAALAFERL